MKLPTCLLGIALLLPACGGGGDEHPAPVEAADVVQPTDARAAVARLSELLEQLTGPLGEGKDLHAHRPVADELAIVADTVGELAGKNFGPELTAKLGGRAGEIAREGRKLAGFLRKDDAEKARVVHKAMINLVARLKDTLPRLKKSEE